MIMNNNLFKTLFIPAVACLLGACTESTGPDMETSGNSGAIRFAGPAVTRAAIDDADGMLTDGNSFSVWGNYTDGTGGTFTVKGFDATKGHDLMTAKKTGISVMAGQTEPPGPVALKFQHLLARITFAARSEGGNATVHSISLEGLDVKGDYDSGKEPLWSNTAEGTVSVEKETSVTPAGNADVSGDLLLIPQSLTDGVKLTVTYDTDAERGKTASYTLPATTVSMWEAANHYRYSFTLTGGGYIVFDSPTVNAWSDAIGGNVTIDVTQ